MKIAAGTLFLGLSMFLHSAELTSAQTRPPVLTTIRNLFSETDGIHIPDIVKVDHAIPRCTTLNSRPMLRYPQTYVKRGHFIFGYMEDGTDYITYLGSLFYRAISRYLVFDTQDREWYMLNSAEIERLGVYRNFQLVRAHDEASATVHRSFRPFTSQEMLHVHMRASVNAYHTAKDQEYEQMYNLDYDLATPEEAARAVKRDYYHGYNEERRRHRGAR